LDEQGSKPSRARFIQQLGQARYGRESGPVGELNLLAYAGLPVPEGVVLTDEFHREFMKISGLLRSIQGAAHGLEDVHRCALEMQLRYGSTPIEGELNRLICEALIELGAVAVTVVSENLTKSDLESIPEVRTAIRDAWLSLEGLERQIEAVARSENLPSWPVLIQRELYPEYTGWSVTDNLAEERLTARHSVKRDVVLYGIRPAGEAESTESNNMAHLTFEAEHLLGEGVRLRWGLKGGRWYLLSTGLRSSLR
jgi:hypothetical protein